MAYNKLQYDYILHPHVSELCLNNRLRLNVDLSATAMAQPYCFWLNSAQPRLNLSFCIGLASASMWFWLFGPFCTSTMCPRKKTPS